jgi:hypothetical protein
MTQNERESRHKIECSVPTAIVLDHSRGADRERIPAACVLSDFSYAIFSERDTIRKGKKKRVVVGFQSALERIKALRKCVIFGH